jgi:hypothetical protein
MQAVPEPFFIMLGLAQSLESLRQAQMELVRKDAKDSGVSGVARRGSGGNRENPWKV